MYQEAEETANSITESDLSDNDDWIYHIKISNFIIFIIFDMLYTVATHRKPNNI